MFRIASDDPHPSAWIRVHLSCAFGDALYPDPQWRQLAGVWSSLYPLGGLPADRVRTIQALLATIPAFVRLVLGHRPAALRGRAVGEVFRTADRSPDRLIRLYAAWIADPSTIRRTRPALAFAVVGQARARGLLTPEGEDRLLGRLISYWALQSTLRANARLAELPGPAPSPRAAGSTAMVLHGWPPSLPAGRGLAPDRRPRAAARPENARIDTGRRTMDPGP